MTGISRENPLVAVRWVWVGSVNEPKLAAVRSAIGAYAPDAKVEGVAVASGVPEQPVGFEEIVRGARNRAAGAQSGPHCDLGIGIEDGLVPLPTGGPDGEVVHLNIGCVALRTFWASVSKGRPSPYPAIAPITFGDNTTHSTLSPNRVETWGRFGGPFFLYPEFFIKIFCVETGDNGLQVTMASGLADSIISSMQKP